MAQRTQNQTREEEKPKRMLTEAVHMRPIASSSRGDVRAPSTPDTNLDAPARTAPLSACHPLCHVHGPGANETVRMVVTALWNVGSGCGVVECASAGERMVHDAWVYAFMACMACAGDIGLGDWLVGGCAWVADSVRDGMLA